MVERRQKPNLSQDLKQTGHQLQLCSEAANEVFVLGLGRGITRLVVRGVLVIAGLLLVWCCVRAGVVCPRFDRTSQLLALRNGPDNSPAGPTTPTRKAAVHDAGSHRHKECEDGDPHEAETSLRIARQATVRLNRVEELRVDANRASRPCVALGAPMSSVHGIESRAQPASLRGVRRRDV